MSQTIQTLFVAGAGQMGHGIAQISAMAGVSVILFDLVQPMLDSARQRIAWSLAKLHEKGKIKEAPDAILARLSTTTDLAAAARAQLVIEAIPERIELKRDLFGQLQAICPPDVLLASNTSAIPISELAAATHRPEQFCGIHFFAPVQLMALVEVIRGVQTSDATAQAALAFVRQIGKEPVEVRRDIAGFVANRVLIAAMLEAVRLVELGVADAKDVDRAMQLGCGWKMGPLETIDLSGLDVIAHAAQAIYNDTGDPKYMPPMLLKRLVAAGHLGRKTSRGFYSYDPAQPR